MRVSVVIVSYNVRHFLQQCLQSVYASDLDASELEVWVVDNASVDGSVEMVRQLFPQAHLIANAENTGFAVANNQALRVATGRYKLLLNPDTVLQQDTLSQCAAFMDAHPLAGALGVPMFDGTGAYLPESKRGLPTPAVAFYKMSGLSRLFSKSQLFGRYHLSFLPKDETAEIDVLSGAFMFMRSAALNKSGLLDETFFMYGEDVDLSYRIQLAGYKNYYFSQTRIIHYKGESTKRASVNYVLVFYKAMHIFARKHFSGGAAGLYGALITAAIYGRAAYSVLLRAWWATYLPIGEALCIALGMYGLKEYWEGYAHEGQTWFPPSYMRVAVPSYILAWLGSLFALGGYVRPFRLERLLLGVGLGSLLISAGSNFLEQYRFSRALILLGTLLVFGVVVLVRLIDNLRQYHRLSLAGPQKQRVLIVGDAVHAQRVRQILGQTEVPINILGWVGIHDIGRTDPDYAGNIANVGQLVQLFNADELIFCAADVPSSQIIETMQTLGGIGINFKIMPEDADFMLGSAGATSVGELYSLDIKLGLAERNAVRKKRFADVMVALALVVTSPFLIWFMVDKAGYLANLADVLAGRRTWVALSFPGFLGKSSSRPGILSPASTLRGQRDEATLRRLDIVYAKDYHVLNDLVLIWRCIFLLDRRRV